MTRTAYISETTEGTIMIKIVPDRSNLPNYQQWIEVNRVVVSDTIKGKLTAKMVVDNS